MTRFEIGKFEKDDWDGRCVNLDIQISAGFPHGSNFLIVERDIHAANPRRIYVKSFKNVDDAYKTHGILMDFLDKLYKAGYVIKFDPLEESEHNPIGF